MGERAELGAELRGGATLLGVSEIPAAYAGPLYLRADRYTPDVSLPAGSRIVATQPAHLTELAGVSTEIEVHLDKAMCAALHALPAIPATWILHAPTRATAELSAQLDPDWRAFFAALPPGTRAQNLPACLCPGALLERPLRILDAGLFHDDGRRAIEPFVDRHIQETYRTKSSRCRACPADTLCEGAHIQSIRAHGFRQLVPLEGEAADTLVRLACVSDTSHRLKDGAPPLPPPFVQRPAAATCQLCSSCVLVNTGRASTKAFCPRRKGVFRGTGFMHGRMSTCCITVMPFEHRHGVISRGRTRRPPGKIDAASSRAD